MQNHWNYGTDVNLTIRKPRKHVHKFNQKNNAHYKAACVDASFIKQIHRQRVCALIGTVSMSMRACGHPKLTTERRTHRTTPTAGNITRNMLPQESTETVERSLVFQAHGMHVLRAKSCGLLEQLGKSSASSCSVFLHACGLPLTNCLLFSSKLHMCTLLASIPCFDRILSPWLDQCGRQCVLFSAHFQQMCGAAWLLSLVAPRDSHRDLSTSSAPSSSSQR